MHMCWHVTGVCLRLCQGRGVLRAACGRVFVVRQWREHRQLELNGLVRQAARGGGVQEAHSRVRCGVVEDLALPAFTAELIACRIGPAAAGDADSSPDARGLAQRRRWPLC